MYHTYYICSIFLFLMKSNDVERSWGDNMLFILSVRCLQARLLIHFNIPLGLS